MSFTLRAYAPSDRDQVIALIRDVLTEYRFALQIGGLENDLRDAHDRYGSNRAGLWVATDANVIVGTVGIRPKEADTCELKRLYLRADKRGLGLGQLLYAHAESFARAAGYQRIWLDSSRRFTGAHRLYERNGFVLVGQIDNDWEDNLYEKRL